MQMLNWLKLSFAGSGSSYLYGFFDQAWKEGMTKDEAEVFHDDGCKTLSFIMETLFVVRINFTSFTLE